jgi:methylphosphotriester-DNA--protein-cysteine methyltransferase
MITDKLKLLAQLKAQTAKLEAALESQRPAALAALPAEFGFSDLKSFIKALKAAAGAKPKAKRGRKPGRKAKVAKPAKGKRVKLTDEIKSAVKTALEQGHKAKAIAKEVGISAASVNVLKKSFGLTKPRGGGPVSAVPDSEGLTRFAWTPDQVTIKPGVTAPSPVPTP